MSLPLEDPLVILACLAGLVALVFQAAGRPSLQPLFERLPALVWAYFLPLLLTSAGVLPAESELYRALDRYLLPACLALLLLSSDLKAVARVGRTALVVMTVGMLGIALGAVAGFALLRPWLPPGAWKGVAALVGTWIGGSANLVAVGKALQISPELQGVIIIVDTVVGYSWTGFLIWLATRQAAVDRYTGADRSVLDAVALHVRDLRGGELRAPRVADLALMVALALGLTATCLAAGRALPELGVLSAYGWAILLLTAAALLLSLTPLARLEAAGASTVGYAGFYLLMASVGARGDLRKVFTHPQFVLLGLIVLAVHGTLLFLAVRALRAPLFFLGSASQACTGGYASAPVVAAIYETALAPVGLLLAVLGNVVGTFAGLAVGQLLSRWGP